MLLSLPAEVCPMKVKMLSAANSLVSPSHCWNTEATNRYQEDDIFVSSNFNNIISSNVTRISNAVSFHSLLYGY